MALEHKTITIPAYENSQINSAINNNSKFGWEVVSTTTNTGHTNRGTTITFKRDTTIPFYERKKEIEEMIIQLTKTLKKGYMVELKKSKRIVWKFLVTFIILFGMLLGISLLVGKVYDAGSIILLISLGITALTIYYVIKSKKKSKENRKTLNGIEARIKEYHSEAENLGVKQAAV